MTSGNVPSGVPWAHRDQRRLAEADRPSDDDIDIATRLATAMIIAAHGDECEAVSALERVRGYVQDLALRLGVEAW